MTIKQIAEVAGVSKETVTRKVKEMYPDRVKNGKPTNLIQSEALCVMADLRKKNFVEPLHNDEVACQNDEVMKRSDMAAFGAAIVTEVIKQFMPLIQNQPKQIDFVQDYYSIKGYASKLGHQIAFSEALALGRLAGKLSREQGKEIRKVDDESFGQVNSYHISVLQEVFQI